MCLPAQEVIVASYEQDGLGGGSTATDLAAADVGRGGHRPPLQRRRNEVLLAAAQQEEQGGCAAAV